LVSLEKKQISDHEIQVTKDFRNNKNKITEARLIMSRSINEFVDKDNRKEIEAHFNDIFNNILNN
jgi:hypothetical protein